MAIMAVIVPASTVVMASGTPSPAKIDESPRAAPAGLVSRADCDNDFVMLDGSTLIYVVVATVVTLAVVMFAVSHRRRARWELVLGQVARALKGRHTAGYRMQLAFIPGSVEASIDGRSLSLGQESVSVGSSSNKRSRQRMVIKIGTSQSKPEFLGAAKRQPHAAKVTDYSGSGEDGVLEVGGQRVQVVKMSNKLKKKLAASVAAANSLAELLAAGGVIEHGNVMLRSFRFELDADRLMARIRNMSAVAELFG